MTTAAVLTLLYTALKVSGPTFGWVVLGVLLRRLGLLSPALVTLVSRFSFTFALPLLLFGSAVRVDYATVGDSPYLLAGVLGTLVTLALAWGYSRWRRHPRMLQGIFVQAAFRSNLAIVGLALAVSAYGEQGLVLATLPVALMTVLYNVLAVWVLNSTLGSGITPAALAVGIVRNPLIIGIGAGVLLSLSHMPVPVVMVSLSEGLRVFFLPVMLVCIGGAMQLSNLRSIAAITWEATVWRLCVGPVLAVVLALLMGVRGEPLGVLFLLISAPVAATSFVMVVAARGDGALAANIVVVTTLLSIITVTLGFSLLSMLSLVGQPN